MTVEAQLRSEGAPAATGTRRRKAPWWLWTAGVAVVIPVAVPMAFMLARVVRAPAAAWEAVFTAAGTAEMLAGSAVLVATVTTASAVVGTAAAWIVERTTTRLRSTWSVLLALPLAIPSYVIAMSYLAAGGSRGLVADLTGIGVPLLVGFPGAWLALTLSTYPYVFLIVSAALRRHDPAVEEAAAGLGATPWRVFRTVTVPLLRPALGAASLLVALYTLSDFGAVSLMRFSTFTTLIYAQYAGRIDRTPAAILSVVLILIALVIILAEGRTRGRATYSSRRPSRPVRRRVLGRGQAAAATVFLGVVVALGVVVPVAVLVAWVLRGIGAVDAVVVDWGAVAGSLVGSTLAALLAMVAAIPVVVLAVRHPTAPARWLERSVYVTFSLPHITIAVAVLVLSIAVLGPLYQSLTLLVIVYATVFLAQAIGPARAALLQVDPSIEEASRSLGRGALATMRAITVPLIWRGLLAGGALVFLTTMKELPVTLLLRPTGFDTLAVRVWSAASELFYSRAAASALVLLAVSAVPMYLLVIRNRGSLA